MTPPSAASDARRAAYEARILFHPELWDAHDGHRARVIRALRDHVLATTEPPAPPSPATRLGRWARSWSARARTVRHLEAQLDEALMWLLRRAGQRTGGDLTVAASPRAAAVARRVATPPQVWWCPTWSLEGRHDEGLVVADPASPTGLVRQCDGTWEVVDRLPDDAVPLLLADQVVGA